MSNIIKLSFFITLLNLIDITLSQEHDKDVLRTVACVSLIRKLQVDQNDQRLISSYMLTCFSSIDDATVQKLIMTKDSSKLDLDEKTVQKLTDFNSLQDRFTQDQLMDFSKDLNKAFEKLRNQGNQRSDSSSQNYRDDDSDNDKNKEKMGLLGMIIFNIIGLFTSGDSLLPLIGLGIMIYIILKQLRKLCDNKDKNENKKSSSNINHKSRKINDKKKFK